MPASDLDMSIIGILQGIKKEGFFSGLVALFDKDSGRLLGEIGAAIDGADAEGLEQHAHALKSASGSIGAKSVHELARQLETAGRTAQLGGASDVLETLKGVLSTTVGALRDLSAD